MNMKLNGFKSETVTFFGMKLSAHTPSKLSSSYDQPSADITKCPFLKLPEKYSHAS